MLNVTSKVDIPPLNRAQFKNKTQNNISNHVLMSDQANVEYVEREILSSITFYAPAADFRDIWPRL